MFPNQVSPRSRSAAFTLIELLVVIGIIALLSAILFPVFLSSREKARAVACFSNYHQIGAAVQMYATDFDGNTPPDGGSFSGIINDCKPYSKQTATFICPTTLTVSERSALEPTACPRFIRDLRSTVAGKIRTPLLPRLPPHTRLPRRSSTRPSRTSTKLPSTQRFVTVVGRRFSTLMATPSGSKEAAPKIMTTEFTASEKLGKE